VVTPAVQKDQELPSMLYGGGGMGMDYEIQKRKGGGGGESDLPAEQGTCERGKQAKTTTFENGVER